MSKCYQLVGVPGSGKSTWVEQQDWASDCVYVSTDTHIEDYASLVGRTYSEVFQYHMPRAIELMCRDVVFAREAGKDIIWDQTSTTVASRAKKFNMLPLYDHIAVVFKTPEPNELSRRLASRPGKDIPYHVIMGMLQNWQEPTQNEDFKEIWRV